MFNLKKKPNENFYPNLETLNSDIKTLPFVSNKIFISKANNLCDSSEIDKTTKLIREDVVSALQTIRFWLNEEKLK